MQQEQYDDYQIRDALTQREVEGNLAVNAPQIHEQVQQAQAVLVEQTDPKNVIKDVMLILRGLEERPDGTVVQVTEPRMNKLGLEKMWFWLKSHVNQGIILSNFEEEKIGDYMKIISRDLVKELCLCWKIYGIQSKTDLDAINDAILMNINAALNRAKGQNEKNWLGRITLENISGNQRQISPKKEGFWGKFRL